MPSTTTAEEGLRVRAQPPPPPPPPQPPPPPKCASVNPKHNNNNNSIAKARISLKSVILYMLTGAFGIQLGKMERWNSNTKKTRTSEITQQPCSQKVEYLESFFNARRRAKQLKYNQKIAKFMNFFDYWEPDAVCLVEERFGSSFTKHRHEDTFGDGPKFVCGIDYYLTTSPEYNNNKANNNSCLVYSVGSDNDVQFEQSVSKHLPGCEIHTFDPTILPSIFVGHGVTTFHQWGLGAETGVNMTVGSARGRFPFESKTLESIVHELGHTGRTINIFKIDCEGCEWDVMPKVFDAMAREVLKIDQIQMEMHRRPNANISHFMESADKAHLRTFHKERNGWGCAGVNCIEYSLASESFLQAVHKHYLC